MEVGSGSSSSSSSCTSSGSLNVLQFDKKSYFGESSPAAESKRPPLAPGKKGEVVVQGEQTPVRCQVEGCQVDLRSAKGYYYRHRVCGIHSKSVKVIVAGDEQRFCQQCSRFHLVPEFDKGKRSCRKRLACHNQRRRKPPSDGNGNGTPFGRNGSTESSSKAVSFMLDFSVQQPVLTGSGDSHSNPNAIPDRALVQNTQTDAHPWHRTPTEIANRSNNFGLRECLTGVSDCSRALSLLSNHTWDSRHQSSVHNSSVVNATVTTPPTMVQVLQSFASSHSVEEESIRGLSNTYCSSSSFKASETNSHMSTELGLTETSQPAGNHYRYHGDLDDVDQQNESRFVGLFEHSVEYDSDSSLLEHSRGSLHGGIDDRPLTNVFLSNTLKRARDLVFGFDGTDHFTEALKIASERMFYFRIVLRELEM